MMRALLLLITLLGCSYDPDIGDGTIVCGTDDSCPPGFQCGREGRCWREQTITVPDAAAPRPDACRPQQCPPESCGKMPNGCGGSLDCGKCKD